MSGARFVVDWIPEAGASATITGEEAAHARARRLRVGDPVVLVDGSGREALGQLIRREREALEVLVHSIRLAPEDPLPSIHLLAAAVRAERLAWMAEKATELGAAKLTLVASERAQSFRARGSLLPRLNRVAREAAKQSERSRWLALAGPFALAEVLASERSENRLILDPAGEVFPRVLPVLSTALLVGPEGGWSDAERAAALGASWLPVALPAGKLRAETAAVSALVLTRAALARASGTGNGPR